MSCKVLFSFIAYLVAVSSCYDFRYELAQDQEIDSPYVLVQSLVSVILNQIQVILQHL